MSAAKTATTPSADLVRLPVLFNVTWSMKFTDISPESKRRRDWVAFTFTTWSTEVSFVELLTSDDLKATL